MATAERKAKRADKKELRKLYNTGVKIIRARDRHLAAVALGKTVIVSETDGVKRYAFPPDQPDLIPQTPPTLSWVSAKTYKHSNPRKNLSGNAPEHAAANIENASRAFAGEVTKALEVPAVDGAPIA